MQDTKRWRIESGFLQTSLDVAGRPALSVSGRTLTYGELRVEAERIAAGLANQESEESAPCTAILAERSVVAYAGILGTLMRGRAYVPLNPKFPLSRNREIIARTRASSLIVEESLSSQLHELIEGTSVSTVVAPDTSSGSRRPTVRARLMTGQELPEAPAAPSTRINDNDVAYVLFTSGSTGRPKAVAVRHSNARHYIDFASAHLGVTARDRFSQTHDLTFDNSVFDLFVAWSNGAHVVVPGRADLIAPARFVRENRITCWFSVPSLARQMVKLRLEDGQFPDLRVSLFAGEALPAQLVRSWRKAAPNSIIENWYGPTETTVDVTHYRWSDESASKTNFLNGVVPIGRAFPGMDVRVFDEELRPVPDGEPGELLVAGPQVTHGYLDDEERTRRSFVVPPGESRTYYRTGDRCVVDANGDLNFLGRMDNQVKVRGYRVELGEVESALRQVSDGKEAVALPWPPDLGSCDSIVAVVECTVAEDEWIPRLRDGLPEYMVPSFLFAIPALPTNSSGKVDRKEIANLLSGLLEERQRAESQEQSDSREVASNATSARSQDIEAAILGSSSYIEAAKVVVSADQQMVVFVTPSAQMLGDGNQMDALQFHLACGEIVDKLRILLHSAFGVRAAKIALVDDRTNFAGTAETLETEFDAPLSRDACGVPVGCSFRFTRAIETKPAFLLRQVGEEDWLAFEGEAARMLVRLLVSNIGTVDEQGAELNGHQYQAKVMDRLKRVHGDPEKALQVVLPSPSELIKEVGRSAEDGRVALRVYSMLLDKKIIRPGIESRPAGQIRTPGVTMLMRPRSGQLYWIFPGDAFIDVLQMPPAAFLRETGLFERNVVLFRDRSRSEYVKGVSLQLCSLDRLISYQLGVLQSSPGIRRSYAVGTSSGAFAAVVTGYHLGLESVWCFGLSTTVDRMNDLRDLLAIPNGVTTYHLYYNASSADDAEAARSLAGLPGVKLHPQSGTGHFVAQTLWQQKKLGQIFPAEALSVDERRRPPGRSRTTTESKVDATVLDTVLRLVGEVSGQSAANIGPSTNLRQLLDSFATVELLVLVEESIEGAIRTNEIQPESLRTPETLAAWITQQAALIKLRSS